MIPPAHSGRIELRAILPVGSQSPFLFHSVRAYSIVGVNLLFSFHSVRAYPIVPRGGKELKEIASLTGYATKQSFLNTFKKYFHDIPDSFRKN